MAIGEKEDGFGVFIGWRSQDGVVTCGVEAENDFGAGRMFEAQALGADGNAAIGADLDEGAKAPNVRPPGAARGGTQDGALFLFGEVPGLLRGQAEFAMDFMNVAMKP